MPLVRVALRKGKNPEYRRALSASIHRAMVETINVPAKDRFQIVTEHGPSDLIYDPSYLDIPRSDGVLLIQITLSSGRSIELKRALFARIAALLSDNLGVRREDVFVSLVEVAKENWSFGNGIAQYA